MKLSPVVRQSLVGVSSQLAALCVGGVVGYPAALLAQTSSEQLLNLDLHTTSWIGSVHGLAGIPSILMPTLMQWKGRKFAFITASLIIITGWIIACSATTVTQIIISEVFHGFGTNSILAVSLLSMSEMVTPKYRNITMISFSIIQSLGMASVGVMARYLYWRTIGIIMCVPMVMALFTSFFWIESPAWLACKGRLDQCERAFISLRGTDDISKKELYELLKSHQHKCATKYNLISIFRSRDFYVPSVHMLVLLNSMYWSGVMVVIIYSMQLIEQMTANTHAVQAGGVVINIILFICFTVSGLLVNKFKHKTVLLTCLLWTAFALLLVSVVCYCQDVGVLSKESSLGVYCLFLYMVSSSLGVNSVVFTVAAELMPVKHRGVGGALYVIYICLLHTTSLKISPYLFVYLNLWGTFLLYALNAIFCFVFIYRYVPETKGRTLQEIECFYSKGRFVETNRIGEELLTSHV